jgi:hypothetical protein
LHRRTTLAPAPRLCHLIKAEEAAVFCGRVSPQIKREMRRRSAIEPVIGHLKEEHRMDRNYLAHRHGDANNALLAATGYNFRRILTWLRLLLRIIMALLSASPKLAWA